MTRDEIRSHIAQSLEAAGWDIADLRVQPDPFGGGWRIVVVSPGFAEKALPERREVVLRGLDGAAVAWLDVLTPQEREWAGSLPLDAGLEDLPLWPEALARGEVLGEPLEDVVFPSELDEDIAPPIVATFYSLRGGVGRSTALAYTARILASRGRKVVCVDMDLEAPALATLFGKEKEIEPEQGLVHLLLALDRGERPDASKHLLRITDAEDLYCLPAGVPNANYARVLRLLDPGAWYREERNPLRELMALLRNELPFAPDAILLDARTGITPFSGPPLFDLADLSIVVFFPHPQAQTGTAALVRALLATRTWRRVDERHLTPEPRFVVSPVPPSKAPEVVRRYEHRAVEWISDWLSVLPLRHEEGAAFVESEITHFVPYREVVATSDYILSDRDVWRDYQPVADWIERFLPTPTEKALGKSLSAVKGSILQELRFSPGTAEQEADLLATFVETDAVRAALDPKIPLVLGRKGTGKTAVFRRLAETAGASCAVVAAPSPLRGDRAWVLGPEGYKGVEEALSAAGADWRQFWMLQSCLSCWYSWAQRTAAPSPPDPALAAALDPAPDSELAAVRLVEKILAIRGFGLLVSDWLTRLDRTGLPDTYLLLDGLDTGFGSSEADRARRRSALEGLLTCLLEKGDGLKNLRFKVVLREDIWRHLRFENKSHFFGRTASLLWADQASFYRVALKHALRSQRFQGALYSKDPARSRAERDEHLDEKELASAWNLLVGERMKGGKTAFTRNWVWNRLADGNGDHSPRYLLQLMRQATVWEKAEQLKNPYERSVIRPRALIEVLPQVSEQALSALRDEEFPELIPVMCRLTDIGRTPVNAPDLDLSADMVNLAREVGLLGVYEGSEDKVERYRVPELFRYALRMTRKGQA